MSQLDMISELEKAYIVTRTPRYPSALSILYCLDGNYEKANSNANAIRSEKTKYTKIKVLSLRCQQAANIDTYFDARDPSE